MIRYFSVIVASFAFLAALGVAQEKPAPKKAPAGPRVELPKDAVKDKKPDDKDAKEPDDKKADDKDADAKKPEEKKEPAEDPKVIVERIKENFKDVESKLEDDQDAGDATRKKQTQIVEDIDRLLKQQQNNKGGGGGGGGGGAGADKQGGGGADNQGGGGGANNQGGGGNNKKPMGLHDPKEQGKGGQGDKEKKDKGDGDNGKKGEDKLNKKDNGVPKNDKGDGQSDPKDGKGGGGGGIPPKDDDKADKKNTIADQKMDVWGHLPANQRKEMDAFQRERFMDRYQEVLRAYYRNIAESGRRKDGD